MRGGATPGARGAVPCKIVSTKKTAFGESKARQRKGEPFGGAKDRATRG